jgi:hypothetical protein
MLTACKSEAPPQASKCDASTFGQIRPVYSIQRITSETIVTAVTFAQIRAAHPVNDALNFAKKLARYRELLQPMADEAGDAYAMVIANEPIRGLSLRTLGSLMDSS